MILHKMQCLQHRSDTPCSLMNMSEKLGLPSSGNHLFGYQAGRELMKYFLNRLYSSGVLDHTSQYQQEQNSIVIMQITDIQDVL